jgi:glutamate racemase
MLAEMREQDIDALILGCTHFPLVRDIFEAEVGPGITVLDSAETTASAVEALLTLLDMAAMDLPRHRLLVTGPAEAFAERAQTMFRASPVIETVDLMLDAVP